MTTKERLHQLVEGLPESEAHAALRYLESLRQETADPVAAALESAPVDDEPLTEGEIAALEAAERDWEEGNFVSNDEAKRQLLQTP